MITGKQISDISGPKKLVLAFFILIILCTFIYYAALANFDLSVGRFVLYMDERIIFDSVKKILHPDSLASFIESIAKGDQRYGSSLRVLMAAFAYFPEQIWGVSGQIITGRMLQVFLIVSASLIFVFGLLQNWYLRIVLLLSILVMPYSDYYMSMPKPEPLQLFFLAVFCFYYFKNRLEFGWYWIFAGLAFGTKISALPVIILFSFSTIFTYLKFGKGGSIRQHFKKSLLSFTLGFALAMPSFLIPLLFIAVGYVFFIKLKNKFYLSVFLQWLLIIAWGTIFYRLSKNVFRDWLYQTFLNTAHGSDQTSINVWSWISFYFEQWLVVPDFIGITFFILAFLFSCFFFILSFRKNNISPNSIAAVAIGFSGFVLNFSIYFGVHRLWGFYLYTGTILMLAGLMIMIDLTLQSGSSVSHSSLSIKLMRIFGYAVAFYLFSIAIFSWAPNTINSLKVLALRTNSTEYLNQYSSYQAVTQFLDKQSAIKNSVLNVMMNPSLFLPESNYQYKVVEFWGPYVQWNDSPDVIVFGSVNTPRGSLTLPDSPNYRNFLMEREGYIKHVVQSGSACVEEPCFEKALSLPNGGEILVLIK